MALPPRPHAFVRWLFELMASYGLTACDKTPSTTPDKNKVSASQPASLSADELALVDSDVITAKAERYQPNVLVTGTLQANQRTAVQSTVNAQVIRVLADVGQAVRQGDALIQLDNRNSQDQVAQARADLAAAQAQASVSTSLAQKNKRLFEQGFVSQIEYERSLAEATAQQEAVKARQAQLNSVQRLSQDTIITAPSAGVVGSRSVNVGQVVAPNQPLMEIIDTSQLEFAANVPSEAQDQLQIGQSVPFTVGNNPTNFVGQISRIAPQVDPVTRQLTIFVKVNPVQNGTSLKAGQFATGHVDYGQIQVGVLVPMSAVSLSPNAPASQTSGSLGLTDKTATTASDNAAPNTGMVWVVGKDKRLSQQSVHIIRRDDANSQYLVEGIEQGTVVVVARLNSNDTGKKVVLK